MLTEPQLCVYEVDAGNNLSTLVSRASTENDAPDQQDAGPVSWTPAEH